MRAPPPQPALLETLSANEAAPDLVQAIASEIPDLLAWLGGVDEVDVTNVVPFDVGAALAADLKKTKE